MLNSDTGNWRFVHQENLKDMKTTEKSFDAVKFMRQERDKITKELVNLSDREILEYFEKKRSQKPQRA
ncbi:hypothetical protein GCM10009119_17720 [Algoriphagus jejuensis]|uniref:Uncharacterized protein n=1 Tax=Algoriphagus jejuensis TaxID=419934 RepID=A0ABP3YDD2_9BACT